MLIYLNYFVILFLKAYAGIIQGPDSTLIISRVISLTSKVETIGYHQWHHDYFNIGGGASVLMPVVNDSKSTYKFEIEKFDNGSKVYCKHVDGGLTFNIKNDILLKCGMQTMKLFLVDNGYYGDKVAAIREYHENESITFACGTHPLAPTTDSISDVFIGWLSPNSETVSLIANRQNEITVALTLDKKYNSNIICCIYYITKKFISHTQIQRLITNRTRLIWKENNEHQNIAINNNTSLGFNTETTTKPTEDVAKHSTEPSKPFEDEPTSDITDFVIHKEGISDNENTPDAHNSAAVFDSHEDEVNNDLMVGVIFAVVLVLIVVMVVTGLVVVKRRASYSARPTLAQNTVPVASPFYGNDLFRDECDREIKKIEEHHYEEIN